MLKKFGILGLALAAVTLFHPAKVNAEDRWGGGAYAQSYGPGAYANGYQGRGDEDWREDRREDRKRDREWREHGRREHEWREHEWRERHRHDRYYRQGYYQPQAGVYFSWRAH
jgi:hypothetical protein